MGLTLSDTDIVSDVGLVRNSHALISPGKTVWQPVKPMARAITFREIAISFQTILSVESFWKEYAATNLSQLVKRIRKNIFIV